MPWTFAHPAAVLAIRPLLSARLSLAALMVGSITPDVGYYLSLFKMATFAHTLPGVITVCLPIGLLLLLLIQRLWLPIAYLLPQPHRQALSVLPIRPFAAPLAVGLSLLIGALTHIVWDSFTHHSGWAVNHIAVLQYPVTLAFGHNTPLFHILQHTSTVLGILYCGWVYRTWLRRQTAALASDSLNERWRYLLLASLGLLALAIATALVYSASPSGKAGFTIDEALVFRLILTATTTLLVLLVTASQLIARKRR